MSNKVKLTIKLSNGKEAIIWTDWTYYNTELAFSKLRDICFWNKCDFNECLKFIEEQGASWIDVSNTMITGMSIAEACDIVKIKKKEANV